MVDDSERLFHHRFFPEVATTTFAVINGLANSPSHRQWEIVQLREDLGRAEDALIDLQSAIHSVRPAAETFTDWTRRHHLTDASADAQADPDNDGSPNFLEFAYGTNPTVTRFHHRPSITRTENQITINYRQANDVAGVSISIDQSSDLQEWKPLQIDSNGRRLGTFPSFTLTELTLPIHQTQYYRIRTEVDPLPAPSTESSQ